MSIVRIPVAICAAVAEVLVGSHSSLNELFLASGAPGPPPDDLPHSTKWKTWLRRLSNNPSIDSLSVLGNIIEEFMDLPPADSEFLEEYKEKRKRLENILEEHGFRYFRGGRVIPVGIERGTSVTNEVATMTEKPASVEGLLKTIIHGLPRAIHPLTHRRKGTTPLKFESEYDIQDLLHSQLRPWISDIRPEEHTPSYAGSSTRMDFLLPAYSIVLEVKRVRDKSHGAKIGDELIIDIEHYRSHGKCNSLWCVVYDPLNLLSNPAGLINDLEGKRSKSDGEIDVKVFIFGAERGYRGAEHHN